jgi:dATP pyrophosphohydrolase
VPSINSFYSAEDDAVSMLPVFAAVVENNCTVKISDEHSEFKWAKADEAKLLLIWPGQRKSVEIIEEYFSNDNSLLDFMEIKF